MRTNPSRGAGPFPIQSGTVSYTIYIDIYWYGIISIYNIIVTLTCIRTYSDGTSVEIVISSYLPYRDILTPYWHHIYTIFSSYHGLHKYDTDMANMTHDTNTIHILARRHPLHSTSDMLGYAKMRLPRLRRLLRSPRRRRRRRLATNARLARPSITTRRRRSPSRRGPSARAADTYHDWRNIYHDYIDTHIM